MSGVAVSGQQHGMVCVDATGTHVRLAKLWCDSESSVEAKELGDHPAFGGWKLPPAMTVTKVAWLVKNEKENWNKTVKVLLPSQYVTAALAAGPEGIAESAVGERSDASGFGVLVGGEYDAERCKAADPELFGRLPRLLGADVVAGCVSKEGLSRLGITEASATALLGAKLGVGGGDNAMAALGAGAVADGSLVVSLGTSGTIFMSRSEAPDTDLSGDIAPFHDACGGYLPLYCVQNCTEPVTEISKLVNACARVVSTGPEAELSKLEELAEKEEPGCGGLSGS